MKNLIRELILRTEHRYAMAMCYDISVMSASDIYSFIYRDFEPIGMDLIIEALGDRITPADRVTFFKYRELVNKVLVNLTFGRDINMSEKFPSYFLIRVKYYEGCHGIEISDKYKIPYRAVLKANTLLDKACDMKWVEFRQLYYGRTTAWLVEHFILFLYLCEIGFEETLSEICFNGDCA